MYYTKEDIARLISEDMPYFDLTSKLLNIENPGKISFYTRKDTVVSGNKLVSMLADELNLKVTFREKDSRFITAGNKIFEAEGENVLILWKVAQNIYEYALSVATYTYEMTQKARVHNPNIEILTTRKIIPFTKKIALNAVIDGGGLPHRITTSETVLVFDNYIKLFGGWEKFFKEFPKLKQRSIEKKWVIEADNLEMAKKLIDIEVDVVQLDKVDVETTKKIVELAHQKNIKVISAGGININNVQDYAKAGVDSIVTTAPYFAKGADVKVVIENF
ncbi:molybdenum transport protein [Lebetimonas natsushimae]|uniref:Putative pyrophosphorylase ModD n=1 Tax=Lebetimonas natsushimae TaxID=1936991 RepID=A0A292YBF4_9BACT|nr:ModD protein [Lebetimonas natsushimae]GAX88292.1 molybdenum transport protein [Lebetimonas natsushimae]